MMICCFASQTVFSLLSFRSYLTGRTQAVGRGSQQSVICGIPQGSVLGPILFIMYTPDLVKLIEGHGLSPHLFADDTQLYGRLKERATLQLVSQRVQTTS